MTLTLSKHGNALITSINDRGVGLEQDQIPLFMRAFTKGKEHMAGAGMGLYISKRLVREMGGDLRITSTLEDGTTFRVTLPHVFTDESQNRTTTSTKSVDELFKHLAIDTPTASSTSTQPVETAPAPSVPTIDAIEPLRVLVVDDNAVCRKILRQLLKRLPGTIITTEADDGDTAMNLFHDLAPHLVLTDISMPRMDGVTSAQHMRRIANERAMVPCKIYAITGLGTSDPRLKAAGLRGTAALDGWLVKGQDDLASIKRIVADLWSIQLAKIAQVVQQVPGLQDGKDN